MLPALTKGFRYSKVNLHTNQCNMRLRNICTFISLFIGSLVKSQLIFTALPSAKSNAHPDTAQVIISSQTLLKHLEKSPFGSTSIKTVPSTFYYNSLGFFCRKELQLEKALSFPLKFRLGSVAYTDQMEGKGKGVSLPANRK